jgi:hypothetical protein
MLREGWRRYIYYNSYCVLDTAGFLLTGELWVLLCAYQI